MPPDSWCGNADARRAASGMPTCSSSSTTRARRARRSSFKCVAIASPTCQPTVKHGLSDDIGSWNTIAMSRPTRSRRCLGVRLIRSRPANTMRSACTVATHGNRPMIASIATDLPEPDSPTMASTSSGSTTTSMSSTALNGPLRVANVTLRPRTSSRALIAHTSSRLRLHRIAPCDALQRGKAGGGYAPALECGSPSLREGCPAVLGLVARRETRFAHCVRCARTIATSHEDEAR